MSPTTRLISISALLMGATLPACRSGQGAKPPAPQGVIGGAVGSTNNPWRPNPPAGPRDFAGYVDPFIGTGGHGHTYPGPSLPFGMVQLSPDTNVKGWDWCSGYHQSDTSLMGFSHTHLSGTGIGDLGDVLLMPTVGAIELEPGSTENPDLGYRSRFSHDEEAASPGFYSVRLADTGVRVDLTATRRAGFHRYTFPSSQQANVIIDLRHGISDKPLETDISIVGNNTLVGRRRSIGWSKDQVVFFAAEFSKPFESFGIAEGGSLQMGQRQGTSKDGVKAVVRFETREGEQILVRVGISAVDSDGALRNLRAEIPDWDFEGVRAAAREAWNRVLGRIEITGGGDREKRIFYTALYRTMLAPTLYSDVDGRFRGSDLGIHTAQGWEYYSTFSLWDTFRTAHPLYTIVNPDLIPSFMKSLIAQADHHPTKQIPIWPLASWETRTMIGQHSIPVWADAYFKGFRGFDIEHAYELMKASSDQHEVARKRGYVAADQEQESASQTLEIAYDDWIIAQLAKALGRTGDVERFTRGGEAWKNLFDKETGFIRPRLADGSWRTPFDPRAVSFDNQGKNLRDYTEGNAWQYLWFVPQDVPGLIEALGGRDEFARKLDTLFTASSQLTGQPVSDVTGLIGQYAHGNEPSHHIAYLYNYAGQPWQTQARVREILDTQYHDNPDGLSGNEDCGQMSSWYVMAALGFFPVNPADGNYAISAPIFPRVVVHAGGPKPLVIEANASPDRKYIDGVALNGTAVDRIFVRHADLVAGGNVTFKLGTKPNRQWAVTPSALPVAAR